MIIAQPNSSTHRTEPAPRVDTRLVAAVQTAAGRRCHEAANLLQAYYFAVAACRVLTIDADDADSLAEARQLEQDAKARLRRFLVECQLARLTPFREDTRAWDRPVKPAIRRVTAGTQSN